MGFELVADDEKFEIEIDGATFYLRRVPPSIRNRMMNACMSKRNGVIDWGRYGQMLLAAGVIGWKNVNLSGVPVEFSKELLERMPDDAGGQLIKALGENTSQLADELKNSPTTPSSST